VTQNTIVADVPILLEGHAPARPKLDAGFDGRTALIFFGILAFGLFFIADSLYVDMRESGVPATSWLPFVLPGVALFIALGFEFVNGFHDTANAVATVIYTHSLPAHAAVVWSGLFNFLGVMASSGAVAYGIIALLPVELILQVGSGAGFAMVFALLIGDFDPGRNEACRSLELLAIDRQEPSHVRAGRLRRARGGGDDCHR